MVSIPYQDSPFSLSLEFETKGVKCSIYSPWIKNSSIYLGDIKNRLFQRLVNLKVRNKDTVLPLSSIASSKVASNVCSRPAWVTLFHILSNTEIIGSCDIGSENSTFSSETGPIKRDSFNKTDLGLERIKRQQDAKLKDNLNVQNICETQFKTDTDKYGAIRRILEAAALFDSLGAFYEASLVLNYIVMKVPFIFFIKANIKTPEFEIPSLNTIINIRSFVYGAGNITLKSKALVLAESVSSVVSILSKKSYYRLAKLLMASNSSPLCKLRSINKSDWISWMGLSNNIITPINDSKPENNESLQSKQKSPVTKQSLDIVPQKQSESFLKTDYNNEYNKEKYYKFNKIQKSTYTSLQLSSPCKTNKNIFQNTRYFLTKQPSYNMYNNPLMIHAGEAKSPESTKNFFRSTTPCTLASDNKSSKILDLPLRLDGNTSIRRKGLCYHYLDEVNRNSYHYQRNKLRNKLCYSKGGTVRLIKDKSLNRLNSNSASGRYYQSLKSRRKDNIEDYIDIELSESKSMTHRSLVTKSNYSIESAEKDIVLSHSILEEIPSNQITRRISNTRLEKLYENIEPRCSDSYSVNFESPNLSVEKHTRPKFDVDSENKRKISSSKNKINFFIDNDYILKSKNINYPIKTDIPNSQSMSLINNNIIFNNRILKKKKRFNSSKNLSFKSPLYSSNITRRFMFTTKSNFCDEGTIEKEDKIFQIPKTECNRYISNNAYDKPIYEVKCALDDKTNFNMIENSIMCSRQNINQDSKINDFKTSSCKDLDISITLQNKEILNFQVQEKKTSSDKVEIHSYKLIHSTSPQNNIISDEFSDNFVINDNFFLSIKAAVSAIMKNLSLSTNINQSININRLANKLRRQLDTCSEYQDVELCVIVGVFRTLVEEAPQYLQILLNQIKNSNVLEENNKNTSQNFDGVSSLTNSPLKKKKDKKYSNNIPHLGLSNIYKNEPIVESVEQNKIIDKIPINISKDLNTFNKNLYYSDNYNSSQLEENHNISDRGCQIRDFNYIDKCTLKALLSNALIELIPRFMSEYNITILNPEKAESINRFEDSPLSIRNDFNVNVKPILNSKTSNKTISPSRIENKYSFFIDMINKTVKDTIQSELKNFTNHDSENISELNEESQIFSKNFEQSDLIKNTESNKELMNQKNEIKNDFYYDIKALTTMRKAAQAVFQQKEFRNNNKCDSLNNFLCQDNKENIYQTNFLRSEVPLKENHKILKPMSKETPFFYEHIIPNSIYLNNQLYHETQNNLYKGLSPQNINNVGYDNFSEYLSNKLTVKSDHCRNKIDNDNNYSSNRSCKVYPKYENIENNGNIDLVKNLKNHIALEKGYEILCESSINLPSGWISPRDENKVSIESDKYICNKFNEDILDGVYPPELREDSFIYRNTNYEKLIDSNEPLSSFENNQEHSYSTNGYNMYSIANISPLCDIDKGIIPRLSKESINDYSRNILNDSRNFSLSENYSIHNVKDQTINHYVHTASDFESNRYTENPSLFINNDYKNYIFVQYLNEENTKESDLIKNTEKPNYNHSGNDFNISDKNITINDTINTKNNLNYNEFFMPNKSNVDYYTTCLSNITNIESNREDLPIKSDKVTTNFNDNESWDILNYEKYSDHKRKSKYYFQDCAYNMYNYEDLSRSNCRYLGNEDSINFKTASYKNIYDFGTENTNFSQNLLYSKSVKNDTAIRKQENNKIYDNIKLADFESFLDLSLDELDKRNDSGSCKIVNLDSDVVSNSDLEFKNIITESLDSNELNRVRNIENKNLNIERSNDKIFETNLNISQNDLHKKNVMIQEFNLDSNQYHKNEGTDIYSERVHIKDDMRLRSESVSEELPSNNELDLGDIENNSIVHILNRPFLTKSPKDMIYTNDDTCLMEYSKIDRPDSLNENNNLTNKISKFQDYRSSYNSILSYSNQCNLIENYSEIASKDDIERINSSYKSDNSLLEDEYQNINNSIVTLDFSNIGQKLQEEENLPVRNLTPMRSSLRQSSAFKSSSTKRVRFQDSNSELFTPRGSSIEGIRKAVLERLRRRLVKKQINEYGVVTKNDAFEYVKNNSSNMETENETNKTCHINNKYTFSIQKDIEHNITQKDQKNSLENKYKIMPNYDSSLNKNNDQFNSETRTDTFCVRDQKSFMKSISGQIVANLIPENNVTNQTGFYNKYNTIENDSNVAIYQKGVFFNNDFSSNEQSIVSDLQNYNHDISLNKDNLIGKYNENSICKSPSVSELQTNSIYDNDLVKSSNISNPFCTVEDVSTPQYSDRQIYSNEKNKNVDEYVKLKNSELHNVSRIYEPKSFKNRNNDQGINNVIYDSEGRNESNEHTKLYRNKFNSFDITNKSFISNSITSQRRFTFPRYNKKNEYKLTSTKNNINLCHSSHNDIENEGRNLYPLACKINNKSLLKLKQISNFSKSGMHLEKEKFKLPKRILKNSINHSRSKEFSSDLKSLAIKEVINEQRDNQLLNELDKYDSKVTRLLVSTSCSQHSRYENNINNQKRTVNEKSKSKESSLNIMQSKMNDNIKLINYSDAIRCMRNIEQTSCRNILQSILSKKPLNEYNDKIEINKKTGLVNVTNRRPVNSKYSKNKSNSYKPVEKKFLNKAIQRSSLSLDIRNPNLSKTVNTKINPIENSIKENKKSKSEIFFGDKQYVSKSSTKLKDQSNTTNNEIDWFSRLEPHLRAALRVKRMKQKERLSLVKSEPPCKNLLML